MAINRAQDRFLPLLNGNVLASGGSLNLAKGQFGIFDVKTSTKNGLERAATLDKDGEYQIRVGNDTRRGEKSKSTLSFKLKDIVDLKVNAPSLKKSVDEVLVGYDGLNEDTALKFEEGDNEEMTLVLDGPGVGLQGHKYSKIMLKFYFEKALGSDKTDQEIVEDAVRRMKETPTLRGQKLVDLVDITTVNSKNGALGTSGEKAYTYYELDLDFDEGSNTLGDIQAQYDTKIEKDPLTGKYVMILPTIEDEAVPAAYEETKTVVDEKCPDGVTMVNTVVKHAWKAGKECFASTEKYTLQLSDDDCGNDYLNELKAHYPDFDIKVSTDPVAGACQTVYEATVPTNLVCEECDPMFLDLFISEAPKSWGIYNWIKEENTYDPDALMGIRIKAKETINIADESLKDAMPFLDTSVRIKVSGGYRTSVSQSYEEGREVFNIKYLSKQEERENMGGQLWTLEDRDNTYFNLFPRHVAMGEYEHEMAKKVLGQESVLKGDKQYVLYNLTINVPAYQGNSVATLEQKINYLFAAEVGKHASLETELNRIATSAGISTVAAGY